MLIQTRKTFDHLQNTNEEIFDEIYKAFCPSIDSYVTTTLTLQKV